MAPRPGGPLRRRGAAPDPEVRHQIAVGLHDQPHGGAGHAVPRVEALAGEHHAVLLANHGPVVAGSSLANAQYATEELEETAKLFLMLRGQKIRPLTQAQVEALRERYNLR